MKKNYKNLNANNILLMHLRKKQSKDGGMYTTTKDTLYRIFRWAFFVMLIACTVINLMYIFGAVGQMQAHLANMGNIEPHQKIEIENLKSSITLVSISAFCLFLSEVWIWFKKPLLQLVFCLGSSVAIILTLSGQIFDKTENTLANNHIIPLAILSFCCVVSSLLHFRQLYKDKKGTTELAELIYKKYSLTATDINEEQWQTILEEYKPWESNSKKRSVKHRLKKQKAKVDSKEE